MGTWSIEGGDATIDGNGVAQFPKNTGTTDIVYTITYIDEAKSITASTTYTVKAGSECQPCKGSQYIPTGIVCEDGFYFINFTATSCTETVSFTISSVTNSNGGGIEPVTRGPSIDDGQIGGDDSQVSVSYDGFFEATEGTTSYHVPIDNRFRMFKNVSAKVTSPTSSDWQTITVQACEVAKLQSRAAFELSRIDVTQGQGGLDIGGQEENGGSSRTCTFKLKLTNFLVNNP